MVGTSEDRRQCGSAYGRGSTARLQRPAQFAGEWTATDEQEGTLRDNHRRPAVECGGEASGVHSPGSSGGETPTWRESALCISPKRKLNGISRSPGRWWQTIVRPTPFMELLVMPGFGLEMKVMASLFMALPEEDAQVLAVEGYRATQSAVKFCRAPARLCRRDRLMISARRQRDRAVNWRRRFSRGGGTADPGSAIFR